MSHRRGKNTPTTNAHGGVQRTVAVALVVGRRGCKTGKHRVVVCCVKNISLRASPGGGGVRSRPSFVAGEETSSSSSNERARGTYRKLKLNGTTTKASDLTSWSLERLLVRKFFLTNAPN
ncbi:unnamed protein product [Ectocarpus sp. CCAP 1310/34]|nr:unnamed protein product [Ectocarpus sp. CCAP 1310/34]